MRPKWLALAACLGLIALLAAALVPLAGDAPFAMLTPVVGLSAPALVHCPPANIAAGPPSVLLVDPVAARAPPLA